MSKDNMFKCKIPVHMWETIFEWYTTGLNRTKIMDKLEKELKYHTHPKTLNRLLKHMMSLRQDAIKNTISIEAQKSALGDLHDLTELYNEVRQITLNLNKSGDTKLYLQAVDRLVSIKKIKLGIALPDNKENKENKEDQDDNTILDTLLDKIGNAKTN